MDIHVCFQICIHACIAFYRVLLVSFRGGLQDLGPSSEMWDPTVDQGNIALPRAPVIM